MENILDTHLLLKVGYSDCLEDSLMLYNIKPGVNIGYIYTASQVFQGYGPRLSCWEDTQREQLDHRATDVVVRDALPESSTSPLCGFRGLKGLHRKVREHWPKKNPSLLTHKALRMYSFINPMLIRGVYRVPVNQMAKHHVDHH